MNVGELEAARTFGVFIRDWRTAPLTEKWAESLHQHPRDEKLHRVIDRTYLRPAPTQEVAAELLALPSSTYRRYLSHAVSRIASWLWDRENTAPITQQ